MSRWCLSGHILLKIQLATFLEVLLKETELNILALQETFLNSHMSSIILESSTHNLWRSDRTANSGKTCGGGLAVYSDKRYNIF